MLPLAVALVLVLEGAGGTQDGALYSAPSSPPADTTPKKVHPMKTRLRVGDTTLTATLLESKASRDFASLLPLTLTMNDLFRREKYGHLPRAISEEGRRTHTYEAGDIAYWPPGPDVAVYYRDDGQSIPDPGIIALGRIDSGVQALGVPGSMRVTIELVK